MVTGSTFQGSSSGNFAQSFGNVHPGGQPLSIGGGLRSTGQYVPPPQSIWLINEGPAVVQDGYRAEEYRQGPAVASGIRNENLNLNVQPVRSTHQQQYVEVK